jgi:hypothetical protein
MIKFNFYNDATEGFSTIAPLSPAPEIAFIQQPLPNYLLPKFSIVETKGFLTQLGNLYSSGDYLFVDVYGKVGKYQFNYAGLRLLGLVKEAITTNTDLRWEFAWSGGTGPVSIDSFLNNTALQDRSALDYAKYNYDQLVVLGGIVDEDSLGKRAGMLAVAHFLTAEFALSWRKGNSLEHETELGRGLDLPRIYRAGRYGVEVLPFLR